jgi:hypothetical protein
MQSSRLRGARDAPEGYISASRGEGGNQVYHLDTDEEEEMTEESEGEDAGGWDDGRVQSTATDAGQNESEYVDAHESIDFLHETDTEDGHARESGMVLAGVDDVERLTSTTTASSKTRGILSKGRRLSTARQQVGREVEEGQDESRRVQKSGKGEAKKVSWEPNEGDCVSDERDERVKFEADSLDRAVPREDAESEYGTARGQEDQQGEHAHSEKVLFTAT